MLKYLIILTLLSSCAPHSPESCGVSSTAYGLRYIRPNKHVTFCVTDSVPERYYIEIQAAADDINNAIGKDVITLSGGTCKDNIYFSAKWSYEPQQQAVTNTWGDVKKIIRSDIYLNGEYFEFHGDRRIDLTTLMTHEFLHALGFGHVTNRDSILFYSLGYNIVKKMNNEDIQNLRCVYGN